MSAPQCHQCIEFIEAKQGTLSESEWNSLGDPDKSSCQVCKMTLKHEYAKRSFQSIDKNKP